MLIMIFTLQHAFDYICLLAPGGRQVYCGSTSGALEMMASHGLKCPPGYNPADCKPLYLDGLFNPSLSKLIRFSISSPPWSGNRSARQYLRNQQPRKGDSWSASSLCDLIWYLWLMFCRTHFRPQRLSCFKSLHACQPYHTSSTCNDNPYSIPMPLSSWMAELEARSWIVLGTCWYSTSHRSFSRRYVL